MIRRDRVLVGRLTAPLLCACAVAACHPGLGSFPWPATDSKLPFVHADVETANDGYSRTKSGVLVREIKRPTRAAMDYAAYHANFMNADPPPEEMPGGKLRPDTSQPFGGMLEKTSLTGDITRTSLTPAERKQALAFAPMVEFLLAKKVPGATALEDLGAAVRSESWGLPGGPQFVRQLASELFFHEASPREIWVKIEFQPWFKGFGAAPDQDRDGFPEIYGRLRNDLVNQDVHEFLQKEYVSKELSPAEIKGWANQLSSYWYPSYNTDLVPAPAKWPDDTVEAEVKKELGEQVFESPTIVMRGKPQGKPTYNVFIVKGLAGPAAPAVATAGASGGAAGLKLPKSKPAARPKEVMDAIKKELRQKKSWSKWAASVAPLHGAIRKRLKSQPAKLKGFAGANGVLFYRNSLEYVVGGDLEKQPKGKNPLPVILEFKKELESHGVDFLFVPVPAKVEIFPGDLEPKYQSLVGQVINPYQRKFLLALGQSGIETVDLLPAFLSARASDAEGTEPLYQKQDTHWTDRGLRLAAEQVAARVKKYPWYKDLAAHVKTYTTKDATFTRFGDLHSRLPEPLKKKYKPETLAAKQVVNPDGSLYDDDPDSPIVVLGDSFTGVYQLTDAEHAGVSAHIARGIGYPVDLVMSYGGGPNVRQKLMRRGADALGTKKLVIYMMTVRDLNNYADGWESLKAKAN